MKQKIKNLLCKIGIHLNWSVTACMTRCGTMSRFLRRIKKNKDAKLHQRIRRIKVYDPTYGLCEEIKIREDEEP